MVFQVRLPGHLDEILLPFEGPCDGLVPGGLHATAVGSQLAVALPASSMHSVALVDFGDLIT